MEKKNYRIFVTYTATFAPTAVNLGLPYTGIAQGIDEHDAKRNFLDGWGIMWRDVDLVVAMASDYTSDCDCDACRVQMYIFCTKHDQA